MARTLTKEEHPTHAQMKLDLSNFFGCSFGSNNLLNNKFINNHVIQWVKGLNTPLIFLRSEEKKLRKIYGNGAFIIAFKSVKDFQQKKTANMFQQFVPTDCHFGNAIWANDNMLDSLGVSPRKHLTCEKINFKQRACIAIIFAIWPESKLILSFCSILIDERRVIKYLQRKRLSATVLRRRYPEFLFIFRMDNLAQVIRLGLTAYCPSLKEKVEMMLPNTEVIEACVRDPKQKIAIQKIAHNLLVTCAKYNVDWTHWEETVTIAKNTSRSTNDVYLSIDAYCSQKYPFIKENITKIAKIVGIEMIRKMFAMTSRQHVIVTKLFYLKQLCMKIEGRKCVYSACSNQESRDGMIEKYKTCSACRGAYYCSRRCQKRDWKQGHKNDCHKMKNISYFYF